MKQASIDEYLASINEEDRAALLSIRQLIHKSIPDVEEKISYGLAAFYYKKKYLIAFGAFKNHLSIFPGGIVGIFKSKLTGHKTTKGSIHFSSDNPIDAKILEQIIKLSKDLIDN
jgi:uncharacterized protein YdhG (YjbR/CyaY superfamily)